MLRMVMEKIIKLSVFQYLDRYKLLNDKLYISTKSFEFQETSWAFAHNISKAHDKIWHTAILNELPSCGRPPPSMLLN